ncbi:hypothetical protein HY993_01575 [Candidatus Micrarchaeota archaeon]|nr:hypothetical protein [Candidatus Micrarchaeota archaeon]
MAEEEKNAPINAENPAAAAGAEEGEDEDDESEYLPFPNARVVKIIKQSLTNEHQLKRDVKIGANVLLGDILSDIAKSMNDEEYFTLSIEHFNKAAKKYRDIALNQKRIVKIKKILEKQRAEIDEQIAQLELDLVEQEGSGRLPPTR